MSLVALVFPIRRIRRFLFWAPALLLAVGTMLSLATSLGLTDSLVVHFQFYLAIGWMGILAQSIGCGRRVRGGAPLARHSGRQALPLLALCGLLFHASVWGQSWVPTASVAFPADAPRLRVLWANVQHDAGNLIRLQDQIEALTPDLVALGEVPADPALAELLSQWPEVIHAADRGLVLLSRRPLIDAQVIHLAEARPVLWATVGIGLTQIRIGVTHALLPTLPGYRSTFKECEERAAREDCCLLVGDWNATPWAPVYRQLLHRGGLRDARQGWGPTATWVSDLSPLIRLPIDHAMLKGPYVVENWKVGKYFGSDHRPICLDLVEIHASPFKVGSK